MPESLPIVEFPDDQLRQVAEPIESFDETLVELIDNLFNTLEDSGGIGLSAPQVGQSVRVSVVYVPDDEFGPRAYINPLIVEKAGLGIIEESCISVPGVVGNVMRPTQVTVMSQDIKGNWQESTVNNMHAVCLQHEIDHLDGKLFIDRLWWLRRLQVKYQLAKQHKVA